MWYVVNNVTGTVLPRGYDTEPIAERVTSALALTLAIGACLALGGILGAGR